MRPPFYLPASGDSKPPTAVLRATGSRRASPIFPVVVALVLLPAIAFASPPDPSWVVGIYDDADGDDVVILIADNAATNAPSLPQIPPHAALAETLLGLGPRALQGCYSGQDPRGPPTPMCADSPATPAKSVQRSKPTIFSDSSVLQSPVRYRRAFRLQPLPPPDGAYTMLAPTKK